MNASRNPSETATPRMGRLARLPVFYGLEGRPAVVAGGNPAAAWKAELLSAAGAKVQVFTAAPSDEMRELAVDPPGGSITVVERAWRVSDLPGAAIAVGAFDDDAQAERFARAARLRGVPVNVVDRPAFCDFSFGAIVNRSPLVIGISTDGAAPVFAKAIRARLEALIPHGFAAWAEAAHRWRARVQASGLAFAARRRFWELFTARALLAPEQPPAEADYFSALAAATQDRTATRGSVTLVGAGPGDPELLTLRAVRALQSADVVLIDDLVSPQVLDYVRREARKMMVGKTGHGPSCKQDEINALMVAFAKAGRRVVRLKGGDPMVFGRAAEEIAACEAADITVEVIPGISAAQAVASRLKVSLTHRELSRRVQYVTGHAASGKLPDDIDWHSVADPNVTTAIYMPTKTLRAFLRNAGECGLPPDTPALAVASVTRPDERAICGNVAELPDLMETAALTGPVVVLIGAAMAAARTGSDTEARVRDTGMR